jgi:glycosyltransferase involved in cell wall biosynthesis
MRNPTICLNMIVKDEADIIVGTLKNLTEKIKFSYWVICDTGSSDNTRELIKDFFKSVDISGELHDIPWKDFAYNRTEALKLARYKTDFALIFDADDKIDGTIDLSNLEKGSGYHLQFGHGIRWKRLCLIDNSLEWYYSGVMHEIIGCKDKKVERPLPGDYRVLTNVVVSARNKKGQNKFLEDAKVLIKAHEKGDGLQYRYAFYAGECLRFSGKENWDESIKWYTQTANCDKTWGQERYWSCYQLGKMYDDKGEKEKAWYWWFKSYEYDNQRQEAFFELIKKCRETNQFHQAYTLYKMLKPMRKQDWEHKLFIVNHIYEHSLYSEMFIILHYVNKMNEGDELLKKLFMANKPLPMYVNMTNFNLKFYINNIKKDNYEFCVKFLRYCNKFNVPDKLKTKILKIYDI